MPDNLVLIGFSCSGKTTLGRQLARRLRLRFVDTDKLIEDTSGRTIPDIFAEDGEEAFRRLEREAIAAASARFGQVISTGGGAYVDETNRAVLNDGNFVVHLQVRPETVVRRLRQSRAGRPRPLLECADPLQRVTDLMAARQPYYTQAPVTIVTDGRPSQELLRELTRRWLAWRRAHRRPQPDRTPASVSP